jgi:dienelactone hydrolase
MLRYDLSKIIVIFFIFQIVILSTIGVGVSVDNTTMNTAFSSDVEKINVKFESSNYTLYGEIYYPSNGTGPFPGIVFCEGLYAYVSAYNWIPEALAKHGYVAMIFDFPGQGKSEGIFSDCNLSIPSLNLYLRYGALIETPFQFISGKWVKATRDAITYLLNESAVSNIVNKTRIGLIGHSLGGITVTETAAQDKRVDAVVALSHGNPLIINKINVPIQFQGGTLDTGLLSIPIISSCYRKANTPKEIIMISGGTHIGFTTAFGSLCLCPKWQKDICLHYTIGWFDYFLKNKTDAYAAITTGTDHLSKIFKSRYNFGEGNNILRNT